MLPMTLPTWKKGSSEWKIQEIILDVPEGDAAEAVENFSNQWPNARLGICAPGFRKLHASNPTPSISSERYSRATSL